MTDEAEVDTGLTSGGLQITCAQSPITHPSHLAGPLAGMMLLLTAGIVPIDINWKSVSRIPSRTTPDTTGRITIQDTVSSADILRAIANIHDFLLEGAIDLREGARSVLYEQLWNLYE